MAFIHIFNPQCVDKLFVSKAAGIFWKGKAGFILCSWDITGIFGIFLDKVPVLLQNDGIWY